ncbi:MAG: carbohydrate kinase [Verrucomicrobiales bacterium]|nr:carbohydrate kinase [Verrucomicrobiales bacterium]
MNPGLTLPQSRVRSLIRAGQRRRILVVGDVLLDQFIWGGVRRISPEAPVPVVDFQRESFMAGGAANVARNLTALGTEARLFGVVGTDTAAGHLAEILRHDGVDCGGLVTVDDRPTGLKTRVIAHQQHIVRIDRERRAPLSAEASARLVGAIVKALPGADAVVVGDYAKGVVNQELLDLLKKECRARAVWLSEDPKPSNGLDLAGLSLITPNRKEAFELAGREEEAHAENPLADRALLEVAEILLDRLGSALLLITLGSQGMLLCQRGRKPYWIPTVAQEVFDVSGAGDTVIASFTLAVVAGASPIEAAIFSNHAAGVVVGKVGTATVTPAELLESFLPAKAAPASRRRGAR